MVSIGAGKRYGVLGFLWGAAEATLFFVLPDLIITYAALQNRRRSLAVLLFALLGSTVGGSLIYYCSAASAEETKSTVAAVPFVYGWMFERAALDFSSGPGFALFRQPFSGIPYKIYTVIAPQHTPLVTFLCLSTIARGARFFVSWLQFLLIGALLRRYTANPTRNGRILFAVYWGTVYGYYWTHING